MKTKPFHHEVVQRAQTFAEDLLVLIPELESLTVVPSWNMPSSEGLPFGVSVGRNGALASPMELMHASVQLHRCLHEQLIRYVEILRVLDQHSADMAKLLSAQQQELLPSADEAPPQTSS